MGDDGLVSRPPKQVQELIRSLVSHSLWTDLVLRPGKTRHKAASIERDGCGSLRWFGIAAYAQGLLTLSQEQSLTHD